jgi:hypothetical protein
MLIELETQLAACRERLKAAKPHSWLAQEFTAKIKDLESIAITVNDIWYEFEMASSQQEALEDQELDTLTQAMQPTESSSAPTPAPSTPSKESEFEAAVKKAKSLIQLPIATDVEAREKQAAELEKQSKKLNDLSTYYILQNMQDKLTEIEKLVKQLDKIAKDLDEAEHDIKKPTQLEFDRAIKNTDSLMRENPSAEDLWHKQHKELRKFSNFYEQELKHEKELKAANKAYNQTKIDQAQKKLNELGPYIEKLSDKIVELEGPSDIIANPVLQNLKEKPKSYLLDE